MSIFTLIDFQSRIPQGSDWDAVIRYGERIRRVAYDEAANDVVASVFPIIDEHRPCVHVFPYLEELLWKAETPGGLDRCAMFLSPRLRSIRVEIGTNFKQEKVEHFISDLFNCTKLVSFFFSSPTSLPDTFVRLLEPQDELEYVGLIAPGALSSRVGQWAGSLPNLRVLEMDLTSRSSIAVEGFFDEISIPSGTFAIPDAISGDSAEENTSSKRWHLAALRRAASTSNTSSFAQLRRVHLMGDAGNIATFLKHLTTSLTHLHLLVEDPPDSTDWQNLCHVICNDFGKSIQALKVSSPHSSKGVFSPKRLSLERLSNLPRLERLEIDLPESTLFTPSDLDAIASAAPNLTHLELSPFAQFSPQSGGPKITLESLCLLTNRCKSLHTIAAVVNASEASYCTLSTQSFSSRNLLRLHLWGSWITDALQVAILLSHMAPRLDSLRYFQEKNRSGFSEAHTEKWKMVSDMLPHLRAMRMVERSFVKPVPEPRVNRVEASTRTVSRAIQVQPQTDDVGIQSMPLLIDEEVDATKHVVTTTVGNNAEMDCSDATVTIEGEGKMEVMFIDDDGEMQGSKGGPLSNAKIFQQLYALQSLLGLISLFFYKYLIQYPMAARGIGNWASNKAPVPQERKEGRLNESSVDLRSVDSEMLLD